MATAESASTAKTKSKTRKKVPAAEAPATNGQTDLVAVAPKKASTKKTPAKKPNDKVEKAKALPETSAEIQEDRKKEAKMRLRAVRDIRDRDVELFVELSEQLYEVQAKKLFFHMVSPTTGEKYKSFQEFAKTETAHSERKANYYLQIWKYYVIDHSREFLDDVKHLGVTMLIETMGFITDDNKTDIVSMIEGTSKDDRMTVEDVRVHVKESRAKAKKEKEKKDELLDSHSGKDTKKADRPTKVGFALFPQQKENLETALSQAKKVNEGTSTDADAIDIISLDFLSHHLEPGPDSTALLLQNVESAIGGKVIHLKNGQPGYVAGGHIPENTAERFRGLLEVLELELGCDLIAVKDKEVLHIGFNTAEDPTKAILAMVEANLGVQLCAVKGEEIIFLHPDLEPYFLGSDEE